MDIFNRIEIARQQGVWIEMWSAGYPTKPGEKPVECYYARVRGKKIFAGFSAGEAINRALNAEE